MGSAISKAANGIGGVVGNVFASPFKTILGETCEDICSGPWDVICFIEHLCVSNLVKLFMILGLCYITLMFLYLLFQVGICHCIGRSLCKMCWAACDTYWSSLQYITCFLWHKLSNTKRVRRGRGRRRRRFPDIERGGRYTSTSTSTSTSESDYSDNYNHHLIVGRKRKSARERRKVQLHMFRDGRHGVRVKSRETSVHVKGGSQSQRQLVILKNHHRRYVRIFKRRRLK